MCLVVAVYRAPFERGVGLVSVVEGARLSGWEMQLAEFSGAADEEAADCNPEQGRGHVGMSAPLTAREMEVLRNWRWAGKCTSRMRWGLALIRCGSRCCAYSLFAGNSRVSLS